MGKSEPTTLAELLHSSAPDMETLLKNRSIAEELSRAKHLTDIVDSRTALNNLRDLDRQMSEWLQELPGLEAEASVEGPGAGTAARPIDDAVRNVDYLAQEPKLAAVAYLRDQAEAVRNLQAETTRLLAVPTYTGLVTAQPSVNMKAVWQSPDEALIHMVPSGDWLPEQGYRLYRVVNGQKELLKEQLLAPVSAVENLTGDNVDVIKDLFQYAELTSDKLVSLGMTAEEFRNLAYSTDTLESRPRIAGKQDFLRMKETLITIPADVNQKMPETDRLLSSPIYAMGAQENESFALASSKTALWKSLSLVTSEPARGISLLKLAPDGEARLSLITSVLEARQQLSTLSFVNDEFAEEAGFLFRDDVSHLNLSDGTAISYVLETPDGSEHAMVVTRGTENKLSKPQGLLGYGMDGKVPLRWDQPADPAERAILSGYFIERKLDGQRG